MSRSQPSDDLISEIAWLYYIRGFTQTEIARHKMLSRPTVIAYLRFARERGLVSIRLDPVFCRVHELSGRLRDTFSLSSANVVPIPPDISNTTDQLRAVCEVAANVLPTLLNPKDDLGVSWGQTIAITVENVPYSSIDGLIVRQLIGSMANAIVETSEACTIELARKLDGKCINLNSPAVCSSSRLASDLRQEPIISEQLAALKQCNRSIYSVSDCAPTTHIVQFKLASAREVDEYKARGANCILAGRFINERGEDVIGPLDERLIGVELDAMRRMDGILVVSGKHKAAAALSALRGGFAKDVILDDEIAEEIMALHDQA